MRKKCIYCGARPAETKDHIPPKNLFSKPKPNNLITVPCCNDCNKSFKKDEDLFCSWVLFGDSGVTQEGKRIWGQKLRRTFKKDAGLAGQIVKSFCQVDVFAPEGIYIGRRLGVGIDPRRRDNVVKKIVRGLFWEEYKDRIPSDSVIEIIRCQKSDPKLLGAIQCTQQAKRFQNGIFEYRHKRLKVDTYESFWVMSFYRQIYFVALVDYACSNS